MRPASREAVEKSLLFLAAFHWSRSVRAEASLALRRLQSKRSVPHPTAWSVKDCLKWLSCADLDDMCSASSAFLDGGRLDLGYPPKLPPLSTCPFTYPPLLPCLALLLLLAFLTAVQDLDGMEIGVFAFLINTKRVCKRK